MPRLRDGVIKRGASWSYVIRVPDPATGVTKPRWVGGFATEQDAKAARDEARVKARRGEYVNRSTSTVADYLAEWAEAHAAAGETQDAGRIPARHRPLHRPAHRPDAAAGPAPGRHLHAVPRSIRARRPRWTAALGHDHLPHPPHLAQGAGRRCRRRSSARRQSGRHGRNGQGVRAPNPGKYGLSSTSASSSPQPARTGYSPSTAWPPTPEPAAANCCTCAGPPSIWTQPTSPSAAPLPSSADDELKAARRAAGPAPSAWTATPWPSCGSTGVGRPRNGLPPDQPGPIPEA